MKFLSIITFLACFATLPIMAMDTTQFRHQPVNTQPVQSNTCGMLKSFFKKVSNTIYENKIDVLQAQNKTVRQFVKQKHAQERAGILKELGQEFNISDAELQTIDFNKKHVRNHCKENPITYMDIEKIKSGYDKSLHYIIEKTFEVLVRHKTNVPVMIQEFLTDAIADSRGNVIIAPAAVDWLVEGKSLASPQDVQSIPYMLIFSQTMKEHFNTAAQRGCIEHEIGGHMRNYHHFEDAMLQSYIADSCLKDGQLINEATNKLKEARASKIWQHLLHFREYQADQDPASKSITVAHDIEKEAKALISYPNYIANKYKVSIANLEDSPDHPSSKKRHEAVKDIRKLLEAQQRWYAGPKGYEKYGQPAYDRMFDKQVELEHGC